jgi:hypothetical protein
MLRRGWHGYCSFGNIAASSAGNGVSLLAIAYNMYAFISVHRFVKRSLECVEGCGGGSSRRNSSYTHYIGRPRLTGSAATSVSESLLDSQRPEAEEREVGVGQDGEEPASRVSSSTGTGTGSGNQDPTTQADKPPLISDAEGRESEERVFSAAKANLRLWPRFVAYTAAFIGTQAPDAVADVLQFASIPPPSWVWEVLNTTCNLHGFLNAVIFAATYWGFVREQLVRQRQECCLPR